VRSWKARAKSHDNQEKHDYCETTRTASSGKRWYASQAENKDHHEEREKIMPTDALLTLTPPNTTKTATFRDTVHALSLPGGTPTRGNYVRFIFSNAQNASGANAIQFAISISYDNAGTWTDEYFSDVINLNTVPQVGELYLLYYVDPNVMKAGGATAPQVAAEIIFSGAGSTPTCTYGCEHAAGVTR
jgi:hypothetical protein